ncbi:MAG: hypothetical protein OXG91_04985 [bacterium]|nr:hypothetical protein [bacterium]
MDMPFGSQGAGVAQHLGDGLHQFRPGRGRPDRGGIENLHTRSLAQSEPLTVASSPPASLSTAAGALV